MENNTVIIQMSETTTLTLPSDNSLDGYTVYVRTETPIRIKAGLWEQRFSIRMEKPTDEPDVQGSDTTDAE